MPYREPHPLRFDAVANFRDLGGHRARDGRRVRPGRLFRSGHLGHATERDRGLLAELGLRRVFDFRTPRDIEVDGEDRLPPGAASVCLPMHDPSTAKDLRGVIESSTPEELQEIFGGDGAAELMRRGAAGLVKTRCTQYAEFLARLAESESYPALFHCSAGKDRAGWAGSVVLLALGVAEEEVIEQYLLSNRATDEIAARTGGGVSLENWHRLLLPLLEVRREYVEASFEAVRVEYGDFDTYLRRGLEFSDAQREQLQANLLEPI
ncbi:MAG: tyrosine-protein phosphatase [Deltaproteobacteria bacterium]|nr:tyrosine-protein phosphatase [Deltaproteobacteria bacterium]MBW2362531.1 tyrosine-protein phosphatase [Deltaproteobacteria bacterium]